MSGNTGEYLEMDTVKKSNNTLAADETDLWVGRMHST